MPVAIVGHHVYSTVENVIYVHTRLAFMKPWNMTLVGNPHACTFASRTSYSFSHLNPRKFPCLVSVRSPLHLPLHRLPACWSLRVSAPLSFIHSLKPRQLLNTPISWSYLESSLSLSVTAITRRAGSLREQFSSSAYLCESGCFTIPKVLRPSVMELAQVSFSRPFLDSRQQHLSHLGENCPTAATVTSQSECTTDRSVGVFGEEARRKIKVLTKINRGWRRETRWNKN